MVNQNPFNLLCTVANQENWCWRLYCTTCGTTAFRFGLYQLGKGLSPDDSEWQDPSALMRSSPSGELQRITTEIRQSENLHEILSEANLADLARNCKFPDFLGFLGLALFFTMEMEHENKIITTQWIPQLRSMVHPALVADQMLSRLSANDKQLQWSDLETIEKDYIHC